MQEWELFFREKSRRRSLVRDRTKLMRTGILSLLFGGVAAWAYLLTFGVPG